MAGRKTLRMAKRNAQSRGPSKEAQIAQAKFQARIDDKLPVATKEIICSGAYYDNSSKAKQSRKHTYRKMESFEWARGDESSTRITNIQQVGSGKHQKVFDFFFEEGDMAMIGTESYVYAGIPKDATCIVISFEKGKEWCEVLINGTPQSIRSKALRPLGWEEE